MADQKTITFKIGDEDRIVIENIQDEKVRSSSIFNDTYEYAMKTLGEYFSELDKDSQVQNITDTFPSSEEYHNNVFAFIGDRGSGKTSCMKSVVNMLMKPTDENKKRLKDRKFFALDMIDPSFIENEANIIGVIIASMYNQFRKKDDNSLNNDNNRSKVLRSFVEVQRQFLHIMKKDGRDDEDDIEALSMLSAAINLRSSLMKLVNEFLEYMGQTNNTLLVVIDDIDLHTKEATNMVEQIRKYLCVPNVLVVMSFKLEQLRELKILQYYEEYKTDKREIIGEELADMADRYLAKFIPLSHRFYMPDAEQFLNSNLIIIDKDGNDIYKGKKPMEVRHAVLQLIYEKTRYLFYNSAEKTNMIVPTNLRDLRHLIKLLAGMENYWSIYVNEKIVKDESKANKYNKPIFKKYLFGTWMQGSLSVESQKLIKELLDVDDAMMINATALRIIRMKFYDKNGNAPWHKAEDEDNMEVSELNYIMDRDNMVYNISLGDVLGVVDYLERMDFDVECMRFLFLIKTFYSIRLYEYYDEYCEKIKPQSNQGQESTENQQENGQSQEKAESGNKQVLKNDILGDLSISNYALLVGGRFFNPHLSISMSDSLTPSEPLRSCRVINADALKRLLEDCVKKPVSTEADVTKRNEENEQIKWKIRIAEFFMLCTFRNFNSRNYKPDKNPSYYNPEFRRRKQLMHSSVITTPRAMFDIGSFLYNISHIEMCYLRFDKGKQFLENIKSSQYPDTFGQSLYNIINTYIDRKFRESESLNLDSIKNIEGTVKEDNLGKNSEWLSWSFVRNMEILYDIVSRLEGYEYKGGASNLGLFFYNLASYEYEVYDTSCHINYRFVNVMRNITDRMKSEDDYTLISSIYGEYKSNAEENPVKPATKKKTTELLTAENYQLALLDEEFVRSMVGDGKIRSQLKQVILENKPILKDKRCTSLLDQILKEYGRSKIKSDEVTNILTKFNQGLPAKFGITQEITSPADAQSVIEPNIPRVEINPANSPRVINQNLLQGITFPHIPYVEINHPIPPGIINPNIFQHLTFPNVPHVEINYPIPQVSGPKIPQGEPIVNVANENGNPASDNQDPVQ